MPADVIMPMLGMAQDTGKVLRWLKRDGDTVAKGEPLLEVETDKVTVEIESPAEGTLALSAAEGDEVPVGTVVALVLAAGEAPSAPVEDAAPATVAPVVVRRRQLASPKARRLAQVHGVDLATLTGSGPNGAVVAADVPLSATAPVEAPAVGSVWRTMADRMQRAWQEVPQFALARDVDATSLRERSGGGISVTDLLVQACAEALRRHPRLTATWRDGTIVPGGGVNVGIAVATEDALVVPVIHGADGLSLAEISARRRKIVEAARAGRLRPDDLQGGVFTISNLGMYGVHAFQAIVNAPQAAILAVGRIVDRPVAIDGGVFVRPVLTLTISFDHRVADGARGAEFLDTLASLLEG